MGRSKMTLSYSIGGMDRANQFIAECVREKHLTVEISTFPSVKFVYKLEKMEVAGKETKF